MMPDQPDRRDAHVHADVITGGGAATVTDDQPAPPAAPAPVITVTTED